MKNDRMVLLTRAELAEWQTWASPNWEPFKRAWFARGFRRPPTPRQRALLWPIADARPAALGSWIAAAKGGPEEAITEAVRHWRALVAGESHAAINEYERPRSPAAALRLGEILQRTANGNDGGKPA